MAGEKHETVYGLGCRVRLLDAGCCAMAVERSCRGTRILSHGGVETVAEHEQVCAGALLRITTFDVFIQYGVGPGTDVGWLHSIRSRFWN